MFILWIVIFYIQSSGAEFADDCKMYHNILRDKHVSTDPLILRPTLQAYAQEWADYLANITSVDHRPPPRQYGENVYWSPNVNENATGAVNRWYNEINNFDWSDVKFADNTGHFTQVIWKSSKELGCAKAIGVHGLFVVANYYPPGNVYPIQFFIPNVKPLKSAEDIEPITEPPYLLKLFKRLTKGTVYKSNYWDRIEVWKKILDGNFYLPSDTDQDLQNIAKYFRSYENSPDKVGTAIQSILSTGPVLANAMEDLLRVVIGKPLIDEPDSKLKDIESLYKKYQFTNDEKNNNMDDYENQITIGRVTKPINKSVTWDLIKRTGAEIEKELIGKEKGINRFNTNLNIRSSKNSYTGPKTRLFQ